MARTHNLTRASTILLTFIGGARPERRTILLPVPHTLNPKP
jgi:hypothetical protein